MTQPLKFQTPDRPPVNKEYRSVSPFSKYNSKCMCEICNCNTHKCPTEYPPHNRIIPVSHRDYKQPNEFTKASPIRPNRDYTPTKADPNHFKTCNQLNFQPNLIESSPPVERVKRGAAHQPSSEPRQKLPGFYDTEYLSSIAKEKPYNYNHPARPKEKPLKSLPFEAKSTYQQNYSPFQMPPHNDLIKAHDNLKTDCQLPFNCNSHYKSEYIPYEIEKRPDFINRNKETHIINQQQVNKPISSYRNGFPLYSEEYYRKLECPMKFLPTPPRYLSPGKTHIVYDDQDNRWV